MSQDAPDGTARATPGDDSSERASILSSSAVMAAGTIVSRLSGLVRNVLLAAALGAYLHADLFNIANTIPNMLYILLAGGVFNAVLVPQLVRAMKSDADAGAAYTNRIITLAALFLGGVTIVMVVAAPWLMRIFLSPEFFTPDLAEQRESVISFARYCLPQVFFYGMFVLVGQVLNARHRFGPMMWAPIANNVIAVAVLVTYLLVFGPTKDEFGPYTSSQELLLGLGSTLGIVVQFLVLLPYLKAAGVRYRPRFDFRGTGLGHTLRLASWTVGYVIVNQIAYTVVVRLASGGSAVGAETGDPGTGYTIYSQTFLLMMVPHSVVTVSLATAILPRLSAYAADGDLAAVSRNVSSTLRTSLSVMIPIALLIPLVSADLTNVVFGWLANAESYIAYAGPLSLFAVGMVFFTTHYMMLRGYYALERTPTVFWVQVVIAVANIGLAVSITRLLPATDTATGLVLAYVGAYLLGATVSYAVLRRLLGGLETPALVRFLGRLLAAALPAAAVAWLVRYGVDLAWPDGEGKVHAAVMLSVLTVVDLLLFVTLARLLRIREVTSVMELVGSRLRR